ncbi:hypothetical protein D3C80_1619940 [compost metagenome]
MLPLPPGVTGVDQQVAAFGQLTDHLQLINRARIRHQLELVGYNRQVVNVPLFVFAIISFRLGKPNQMSDCPGDDVLLPF